MSQQNLRIRQMSLDLNSPSHIPLSARIAEFRQDPQYMDQMTEFVDDVINNAQIEANRRLDEKNKVKCMASGCRIFDGLTVSRFFSLFPQTEGKRNAKGKSASHLNVYLIE